MVTLNCHLSVSFLMTATSRHDIMHHQLFLKSSTHDHRRTQGRGGSRGVASKTSWGAEPVETAQSAITILEFFDLSPDLTHFLAQVKGFRSFWRKLWGFKPSQLNTKPTPGPEGRSRGEGRSHGLGEGRSQGKFHVGYHLSLSDPVYTRLNGIMWNIANLY